MIVLTIKQLIKQGRLVSEIDKIDRYSAINISFLTIDGTVDQTQLNIQHNVLTKVGSDELEELFNSLVKEFNTKCNNVISCTVVGSASTYERLLEMGY